MMDLLDGTDRDLLELTAAVDEVSAVMQESWFHELATSEISREMERLTALLEEIGFEA